MLIPALEQEHVRKAASVGHFAVYPEYPAGPRGTHPMQHLATLLKELKLTGRGKKIGVDTDGAFDDDEAGWPGGDLDVFADDGLPADELRPIVTADDLWADEMVGRIAERLGFAAELTAAVGA